MSANAWVLSFDNTRHAAIGELELVHVLADEPPLFDIPRTPVYCAQAFVWQERILPLLDVAARLEGQSTQRRHIAVVRWRDKDTGTVEHGGVALCTPPKRVQVDDEQQCAIEDEQWQECSLSCFRHEELGAVPIVALDKVFA